MLCLFITHLLLHSWSYCNHWVLLPAFYLNNSLHWYHPFFVFSSFISSIVFISYCDSLSLFYQHFISIIHFIDIIFSLSFHHLLHCIHHLVVIHWVCFTSILSQYFTSLVSSFLCLFIIYLLHCIHHHAVIHWVCFTSILSQ